MLCPLPVLLIRIGLPGLAGLPHGRHKAAPDRLAVWMAVAMILGVSVLAALAYPRWTSPPQPPLQDTYYTVMRFPYLASAALFYSFAAIAFLLIRRHFPLRPG